MGEEMIELTIGKSILICYMAIILIAYAHLHGDKKTGEWKFQDGVIGIIIQTILILSMIYWW